MKPGMGVSRPVGSSLDPDKETSTEDVGDVRFRDLLLIELFSFELSEPPRFLGFTSTDFCRLGFDCRDLEDGISLRKEINTDSSMRL